MKNYRYKYKTNSIEDMTHIILTFSWKRMNEYIINATPDMLKIESNGMFKIINVLNERKIEVSCDIMYLDVNDILLTKSNDFIAKITVETSMKENTALRYLELLGMISSVKDKINIKIS